MWRSRNCYCHLVVTVFVLSLTLTVNCSEITNFIATNTLPDGEVETRIYYGGVSAKETTAKKGGLKFRQLTDGKHMIQLIYNDDNSLGDCEFGHRQDQVNTFLVSFKSDLRNLIATSNITIESFDGRALPEDVSGWFHYAKLRKECKRRHREIKRVILKAGKEEKKEIENKDRKRDLGLSDIFRIPGTKWCGKGYSADKYTRLGGFSKTDKCCRRHDMRCPFYIEAMQTKYGLYNWRFNTLMHCDCDELFRSCLKTVRSSDANLVGNIFFNVVQTKCFVLKAKKKCVRRSWWGKCEKFKYLKQAVLRDNLRY
ncbi:uncharacterized protein LOC109598039 isoform X2 [Aethina tumida]|uniref:uncharacterized protein LOC109598039 isoform X2 n=1 Tax=Aethina tumida TaxID=116153 RepID=UPI00096B1E52|nr:uncharacterized protein LOC109598039 isoform X2 [Aethina tumida]